MPADDAGRDPRRVRRPCAGRRRRTRRRRRASRARRPLTAASSRKRRSFAWSASGVVVAGSPRAPATCGSSAGDEVDRRVLERELALALALVLLAERLRDLLVVALERLEGLVGDALGQERGRGAEQRVAALDVGVEEGERPAGLERLQPELDLAELDRHRVDVDAVEAAGDDVAQRVPGRLGRGLLVAGAHGGEALRDPVGGGDEEVAGAAGGIARPSGRGAPPRPSRPPRRAPGRAPSRAGTEIRLVGV